MKKTFCIILTAVLVFSLCSCAKETPIQPEKTEPTTQNELLEKVVQVRQCNDFGENQFFLNMDEGTDVRLLISDCEFTDNPVDILYDAVISLDGKNYSYDSVNGIIAFSNENHEQTAQLDERDKNKLNFILSDYMMINAYHQESLRENAKCEKFVLKDFVRTGPYTELTLVKYDAAQDKEYGKLYIGKHINVDFSVSMHLGVEDIVDVMYVEIEDCYPDNIIVLSIGVE